MKKTGLAWGERGGVWVCGILRQVRDDPCAHRLPEEEANPTPPSDGGKGKKNWFLVLHSILISLLATRFPMPGSFCVVPSRSCLQSDFDPSNELSLQPPGQVLTFISNGYGCNLDKCICVRGDGRRSGLCVYPCKS